MGQRNTDTAVLIFSLSARREAKRKRLFGRGRENSTSEFFQHLIRRTKNLAAKSGVAVFFVDEGQQRGDTFGERYANAFQEIFDKGYSKVVSIGNDTPDLTADTLRKAVEKIQHNDIVVGPSIDGGIYLLGLSRFMFNTDEFLKLPWLKASLYDALTQRSYWQQGDIFSLGLLADIDDKASLLHYVQVSSEGFLTEFILMHLLTTRLDFYHLVVSNFETNISPLSFRGPPSFPSRFKSENKAA
ncbi:MAG TPA: DUF2064 domain-containing protein [Pricia antarctica]|uniref:DUF2064 domain-containing protein n=1 Tax=Pricia antarctica TaxID=641691 RepID=A0A831QN42_9FLAO|nr:DUF2064 domain-containing protein [Pricia antarctica]